MPFGRFQDNGESEATSVTDVIQPHLFGETAPAPPARARHTRHTAVDVEALQQALTKALAEITTLRQQLADAETEAELRVTKVRTTSQAMANRQISVLEAEIDRLREENVRLRGEQHAPSPAPTKTRPRK
jgi:hypothetical protein